MIIHLYTLCYNEMKIAPFVIDYWKKIKKNCEEFHVVIMDNDSTDGILDYLKQFDWIEVRHFDSDGIRDDYYVQIKDNIWKESRGKADFVIVCDFDECLFIPDFKILDKIKSEGYTLILPYFCNMCSREFPLYQEGKLYHELEKNFNNGGSKFILFNPDEIKEINYSPGAHSCNPAGNVKKYISTTKDVCIIHLADLGLDYCIWKKNERYKRLSQTNKEHGWGIHYQFSDKKIIQNYYNNFNNSEILQF